MFRDRVSCAFFMRFQRPKIGGLYFAAVALAFNRFPLSAQEPNKSSNSQRIQVLSTREQAEIVLELIKDPNPATRLNGVLTLQQFATLDLKLELLGDSNSLIRKEALRSLHQVLARSPMEHTFGERRGTTRGDVGRSRQSVQFSSKSYTEKITPLVPRIKERLETLDKDEKEITELVTSCLTLIDRNESFKKITIADGDVAARKEPPEGKFEIQKGMLVLLTTDGKRIAEFGRHYGPVNCWALHSNNRWLAIGSGDTSTPKDRGGGYTKVGFIEIYDLKTNQRIEHIHGAYHFGPVTKIGFDGDRLTYAASDYEESGGK